MQPMLFRIFTDKGLRTFSWRLCGRIVAVFSREERERAVELYFSTPMSTKQVVEHLGYPTRQCLERWLHADPRYADVVAKPPVPLGARRRAVELCLSGMQRKQAAAELGAGAGAAHHWMRLYRAGGMAALGTGTSEKVIRGIMREDGLVARVPGRRRYSSYEGEAASRAGQPRRPGFHRSRAEREMAHGHHAGSRPATERCTFRR